MWIAWPTQSGDHISAGALIVPTKFRLLLTASIKIVILARLTKKPREVCAGRALAESEFLALTPIVTGAHCDLCP